MLLTTLLLLDDGVMFCLSFCSFKTNPISLSEAARESARGFRAALLFSLSSPFSSDLDGFESPSTDGSFSVLAFICDALRGVSSCVVGTKEKQYDK